MSTSISCPSCGRSLAIKERLLGQTIKCPACQQSFLASVGSAGQAPAPAPASPVPGNIGRFRILAALGQGGFGTVYRAHDPILNREVAIKVPRPDTRGTERLIREAQAAAPLRHPHIVAVFEAGADGDNLYIASEYVAGQTLSDRVGTAPVSTQLAAEWVRSLAEALHYAHGQGIVHRDVKPQNVMIDAADRAQLMDFGLAQSVSSDVGDAGGVVGTANYMPPEQARGESAQVGPHSDQYSLGAVLYELLTRRPPFEGDANVVASVASGVAPAPPRRLNPGISRDLEAICLKAMSPEPRDRYADCGAFAEDLGRWINGELVRARRYSAWELLTHAARKRPALFGWTAAAICLLALLLGGGAAYGVYYFSSRGESTNDNPPGDSSTGPQPSTEASGDSRAAIATGLDAEMHLYGRLLDRTRFAFYNNEVTEADRCLEQTRWDFRNWEYRYLRRIVTGGWKTLHGHISEITALAIHPDGKRFVSAAIDGSLNEWDIATGESLHKMLTPGTVTALAYSPDGSVLAISTGIVGERPSRNMSVPRQMPVPEVAPAPAPPQAGYVNPSDETSPVKYVLDQAPQPTPQPVPVPQVNQPLYFVMLCRADTLELIARYEEHAGPIADLAFSPDGRLIASGEGESPNGPPIEGTIRMWDVATLKTVKRLAAPSGPIRRLSFAPDGKKLAASTGQGPYGAVGVWNLDPNAPPVHPFAPPFVPAQQAPAPVLEAPVAPLPVPAAEAPVPVAPEPPQVDPNAPLMPERVLPGSHLALALTEYQLLAAPAMDLWLLENNRRRISGENEVVHRWTLPYEATSSDLRGLPSAVYDLAITSGSHQWAQQTLLAGGDPLRRSRPGTVMLHDPVYQYGVHVPHRGHRAAVTTVAFRPDGKQFISGSADGALKIWNAETHPETIRLPAQPSATRVAFGKDGRYVAVAGRARGWYGNPSAPPTIDGANAPGEKPRGTVKLMDIQTGRDLLTLTAGPGDVLALVMDPAMNWVAAGGEEPRVYLWDLDSGQLRFSKEAPGIVRSLAVSADGRYLAAACGSRNPYATDEPTLEQAPQPVPAVPQSVETSSDSPDDLSACDEPPVEDPPHVPVENAEPIAQPDKPGFVVLWNVETGMEISRWQSHDSDTLSVAFSPDGTQLATSGADKTVRLWSMHDHQLIRELDSSEREIIELAYRPTGRELAGVGHDPCRPDLPGAVIVWSLSDGSPRLRLQSHSGSMHGIAYSPDGARLATSGGARFGSLATPGHIVVWDAETGIELLPLAGPSGRNSKTEFYEVTKQYTEMKPVFETILEERLVNGEKVIEERVLSKMVPETKTRSEKHGGHVEWEEPGAVLCVAFSGDGRSLAAACEDGSALVWDAETCQPHDTLSWPNGRMLCAAESQDGKWIATAGDAGDYCSCQGLIRVYDAVTGRLAREIVTDKGPVRDIAFTIDGRHIVSAGACSEWMPFSCAPPTDEVPFVRPEIGEQFWTRKEQTGGLSGVEVWDRDTGRKAAELTGHAEVVTSLAVHSTTGQILTGSADGSVRLWDSKTFQETRRWSDLGPVARVEFAPETTHFAVASQSMNEPGRIWYGDAASESPLKVLGASTDSEGALADLAFDETGDSLHGAYVSHHAFDSPRGELLAIPSVGIKSQWDLSNDGRMACWPVPFSIHSLDWVPNRQLMAFGSNREVVLLDPQTGAIKLRLGGTELVIDVLPLSSDRLAAFTNHNLTVWRTAEMLDDAVHCGECDPPRGRSIVFPNPGNTHVSKVRFADEGRVVATAGHVYLPQIVSPSPAESPQPPPPQAPHYNSAVTLYDAATARVIDSVTLPGFALTGFDLSPDARYLAVVRPDGVVLVWDREAGRQVAECRGHTGRVTDLRFHPSGERFATAGHDGTIRLWALDGTPLEVFPQGGYLESLAFDPAGKLLAVGDQSRAVQLWDVASIPENREPFEFVWIDDAPPRGANLLGHSPWEFVSAPDHPVHSGEKSMRREGTGITQHYFDGVGRRLTLGEGDTLFAWVYLDPQNPPRTLMLQFNDGNWEHRALWGEELIPYGTPGTAAHRHMGELPAKGEWVRLEVKLDDVGLQPGASLNGWSFTQFDGLVYWDKAGIVTRSPQPIRTFANHYGPVSALAFSGDGRSLACSSYAWANDGWVGDLKVWDVATGERTLAIPSHSWSQIGIAFHPTLPYIASTGKGHQLQVFHAETGQVLLSVPTLGHECRAMAFSPDGNALLVQLAGMTRLIDASPEPMPFGNAAPATAKQEVAEFDAARWVLEQGGRLQVLVDGGIPVDVGYVDDLPPDAFVVSRVTLTNRDAVSDASIRLLRPLSHLRNLSLVNLRGITDAGLPDFATMPRLTELNLEGLAVTGGCLAPFRDAPRLTYLNLLNTKLTDESVQLLRGSNVNYLFLGNTPIGDASAELLREISAIELGLNGTRITDSGIAQLKGFRGNTLHLYDLPISDTGLRELLSSNPQLVHLNLTRTRITDGIVDDLARISTLQRLYLYETGITDAGVARLRSSLPNCHIEHSFKAVALPGPAGLPQPIGYWSFDDVSRIDRDFAAEPVEGTVLGGVTPVEGVVGQAAHFTSQSRGIRYPTSPKFQRTGPFTLCCWATWEGTPESRNARLLGQWTPNDGSWQIWRMHEQWGFSMMLALADDQRINFGSSTPLNDADWHHFVYRFDGTAATLFVDGVPAKRIVVAENRAVRDALGENAAALTGVQRALVDADFLIGALYPGAVDEVRLYAESLSDSQIEQLFRWRQTP